MLDRRLFMKTAAAAGVMVASSNTILPARASNRTIKIGFVTPITGPLASFSEPDQFVMNQFRTQFADGITIQGQVYPIEIIVKDGRSSAADAAIAAQNLILNEKVDILAASSAPETTSAVAEQAEKHSIPCITNDAPWQSHFYGRGGDPEKGFRYSYHFFWGLEDVIPVFLSQWSGVETNKIVGALWPDDPDGLGWSAVKIGFPPAMELQGYKLIDPGRYKNLSGDFSEQIAAFKQAGVEIVTGVMIPADLATFLHQAEQKKFKPRVINIAKAAIFPSRLVPLGKLADNLSAEVWWHRNFPFVSSATGQSCDDLAYAYERFTGHEWMMSLGTTHALFEVVVDSLKRTENINDALSIANAIKGTKLNTMMGLVDFSTGPVPSIATTPLVGGQWQEVDGKLVLQIVNNNHLPAIAVTSTMRPIT